MQKIFKYILIITALGFVFPKESKAAFIIKGTTSIKNNVYKDITIIQNVVPNNTSVEQTNISPYQHYNNDRHVHSRHNKKQWIAILLSFPLFGLCFWGIHRFYLGYEWQGYVQLLAYVIGYIALLAAVFMAFTTATSTIEFDILIGIAAFLIYGDIIWTVIDFFRICFGNLKPKYGDYYRPNRNRYR